MADTQSMVTHTTNRGRLRLLMGAALATLMVAGSLFAGSTPALADEGDAVAIEGSGWGHGVGMSQFGAYGMATEGHGYKAILAHFYQGSSVGTLGEGGLNAAPPIWVNLEADFQELTLRVDAISGTGAPVTITRGAASWNAPVGTKIVIHGPTDCYLTIDPPGDGNAFDTPQGGCAFNLKWYAWNTAANPTTKVAIVGCTNPDWNVVPLVHKECQYGRGMLHVRSGPGGLDLSAKMKIDDYVLGISESPYYWPVESLKAQAVAARSYARELQIYRGGPATNACDAWCHVRDTVWDQNYVGWGHGTSSWIDAVSSTAKQVVTHPDAPNNDVVRAYYSSSTGGRTENIQEVWSGWDARAYYQGVDERWSVDGTVLNPSASWSTTIPTSSVASALGLSKVTSATVSSRNSSGSAAAVTFGDGTQSVTMSSTWLRTTFGLKSIYFDIVGITQKNAVLIGGFSDIANSVHVADIVAIRERGVTKGCNPPANDRYCPEATLTRGQMAAFLARAFAFPADGTDYFTDDNASVFEGDINRLAAAGVTLGCAETRFCPNSPITRGQMAAFIDRAFGYTDGGGVDRFNDDNGSIFEQSINRVAAAGVTLGCNPPANTKFCPKAPVSREQMASFIERALTNAGM